MKISIRKITENELPKLYELRDEVLRKPLGMNLYHEDFTQEKDWIKIGGFDEQNNLIACVMLSQINDDTMKLRQMAVATNCQGHGFGRQIVAFAEVHCLMYKFKKIELHARANAMDFYKKLNYVQIEKPFLEVGLEHWKMKKEIN
jgi:predicted GNAT family N-acyltransferase